ncbi:MAG: glycosyltransferase family 39 protein [Sphingobium sp.]|uniref:glycosyltransferase family 39 protein n=1 Tax=Sphingobium sp. TaxID=1912891 RepID=UPI0029B6EF7E|nr:glycosyltransferase family 39 protein [Sphingobium sp.]MDX3909590.1 glycosyltransferase family 39 protein [Sphingobium sp.]
MIATVLNRSAETMGGVPRWGPRAVPAVLGGVMALAVVGLFVRIMAYPLRHDEQMYVPVGALLGQGDLYRDFGFNNLPNLPLLMALVFNVSGTDHYLLTGRLVIFGAWLLAATAMALIAWRAAGSVAAAILAALLLMTNPLLLGPAGMLATNNFLPMPFAILGTCLFIAGLDRERPSPWMVGGAGLCLGVALGFKANYVFLVPPFALAAFLAPGRMTLPQRLRYAVLPLLIGGLIGCAPVLFYFLRDPDGFLAHVMRYHRGPHIAYWEANPSLDGPKVMTLAGKVKLAANVWLGGGGIVVVLAAIYGLWANRRPERGAAVPTGRPLWPILLVAALAVGGALISFVPTPAFPQYYILPIPFVIALVALSYGRLPRLRRTRHAPWLMGIAVLVILAGMPRLLVRLPRIVTPESWTGYSTHAAGKVVAAAVARNGTAGPIATLAPLYPLEGGLQLYPELAAGPLVYRVGDLIPEADRKHYRMISPTRLPDLFASQPPAAILTGLEGELDDPFVAYARSHGYRPLAEPVLRDRYGTAQLYLRPMP